MSRRLVKVLIVEDNVKDVRLLQEYLTFIESAQFEVHHAADAKEALKQFDEQVFNIIIVDLNLPDSHGLDTFSLINLRAPEVPIVVLTGVDDESMALQAVRHGAQDYLVKGRADWKALTRSINYSIERHEAQLRLRRLSLVDELTGLYNRRGFLTHAEQNLKLARRAQREFWLILGDLDGLKKINDTYGHPEGDRAIVTVADILKGTFRESDIVARIGGDEFAMLAIEGRRESSDLLLERLKDRLRNYNEKHKGPYELAVSTGCAFFDPHAPITLQELIDQADAALYSHKRSRKQAPSSGPAV